MSALIEVLQPGIGTTVQDRGRHGWRHQGVPLAGWLDEPLAQAANALLGNPPEAAVLELRGMGTTLRALQAPVQVALVGEVQALCRRAAGAADAAGGADAARAADAGASAALTEPLPAWRTLTLQPGDELQLGLARSGCAYLAVAGGLQPEAQLGSRSSEWRAGLPGVLGRPLAPGDLLPCGDPPKPLSGQEWQTPEPWRAEDGPIRVIAGPQADHFSPAALAAFEAEAWEASAAQDRMGLRLQGPPLAHRDAAAADIVSDAATPGAIQVPANGLPIVLMADCQTVGGYPKIATVIRADLPRLAHLRPGSRIRFQRVSLQAAQAALQQRQQRWQRWAESRRPLRPAGGVDLQALYSFNLLSGVVDALADDPVPDAPMPDANPMPPNPGARP